MAWGAAKTRDISDLVDGVASNRLESVLILKHRRFELPEAESLAAAIRASSSITELVTSSQQDVGIEGVRAIGEAIGASTSMKRVDVGCRGDDEVNALASNCLRCPTLRSLHLAGRGMSEASCLNVPNSLQELDVARNRLTRLKLPQVLDVLDVSENPLEGLEESLSEAAARDLRCRDIPGLKIVGVTSCLKLDLSGCDLVDVACLITANLRELRLSRNRVTDQAAQDLAEAIDTLEYLDVSSNCLSRDGVSALIAQKVTEMHVSEATLSDQDVANLALIHSPVEVLGMSAIGLTETGAESLCGVLTREECSIRRLEAYGNEKTLGKAGVDRLKRAVEKKLTLEIFFTPL